MDRKGPGLRLSCVKEHTNIPSKPKNYVGGYFSVIIIGGGAGGWGSE